ncbi:MAG: outer membrane lipoprotein carrier protein LolA [Acidobacteria bacterium]|nr:outer membrane lipoprotein carrier protein LolA [Acidobacteriota bacterium]
MQSGFRSNIIRGAGCRISVLIFAFLTVSLGSATPGSAQASSGNQGANSGGLKLEQILAGMDQAAERFSSVAADLEYTKVTVIVDDHSTERGSIYFEKSRGKLRVMLAFQQPSEKYVLFSDGKVSIYRPKIAEVEEYSLANNRGLLEQFLLLGFGTSGSELQKSYQVALKGEEKLDGETAVHLELIPKNTQVSARLERIELWLSAETWQPLQQKFLEPSKDYLIARYRNLVHNTAIAAKNFRLPLRGKVRTVRPQAP